MNLLIATHNKSKFKMYKDLLEGIDIQIYSLQDLDIKNEIEENGDSVVSNAVKKAVEYSKISGYITLAVDDGLIFESIPDNLQPNTNVRRINLNERATDEEMIEYYTGIVKKYGIDGRLKGKWIKCMAISNIEDVYYKEFDTEKIFLDKVHAKRNDGYPLDSISIDPKLNKYTVEITKEEYDVLYNKRNVELREFTLSALKMYK